MDTQLKKLKNPMLRGYLVSKAHKNKISNAMPTFSGTTFSFGILAFRIRWTDFRNLYIE